MFICPRGDSVPEFSRARAGIKCEHNPGLTTVIRNESFFKLKVALGFYFKILIIFDC